MNKNYKVALFLFLLPFCFIGISFGSESSSVIQLSLFSEKLANAEELIASGAFLPAKIELRQLIYADETASSAKKLLCGILASETYEVNIASLTAQEKVEHQNSLEELVLLQPENLLSHYKLLDFLESENKETDLMRFCILFLKWQQKIGNLDLSLNWYNLLCRIENRFKNVPEFSIYRWHIIRVLCSSKHHKGEYSDQLKNMEILSRKRLKLIAEKAEVSLATGDISGAVEWIDQIRFFSPDFELLSKLEMKLKKTREIERNLGLASKSLREKNFAEAMKFCKQALLLDPNNPFGKELEKQINYDKNNAAVSRLSVDDRYRIQIRNLKKELAFAEEEQDLLKIKGILKELLLISSDSVEFRERLKEVETSIFKSKIEVRERFKKAQELFEKSQWKLLRLHLNKNPGLMSSMDRLVDVWEMKLMVNYKLALKEAMELEDDSKRILEKSTESFYANYVMLRLKLANQKYDDAQKFYDAAFSANPNSELLTGPGWILWIHGRGRPFVVIVFAIFLILLAKLIKPFFAWFESTYFFRVSLIGFIFPSFALRSMESCFGSFNNKSDRIKIFELMIKCAQKIKNTDKVCRYAENLLEISPDSAIAINALGRIYARKPNLSEDELKLLILHSLLNPKNLSLIEKTGTFLKSSGEVKVEDISFLKLYLESFPDDKNMFSLIGKSFLELPANLIPEEGIFLIEKAWEATQKDELWWNLWRVLVCTGRFDLALDIYKSSVASGLSLQVDKLFRAYLDDQAALYGIIANEINQYDFAVVKSGLEKICKLKYVSGDLFEELCFVVEKIVNEEDEEIRKLALEAIENLKSRQIASSRFYGEMLAVEPKIESERQLTEESTIVSEATQGTTNEPIENETPIEVSNIPVSDSEMTLESAVDGQISIDTVGVEELNSVDVLETTMFNDLNEIQAPPDVSEDWLNYLNKKPDSSLFAELE